MAIMARVGWEAAEAPTRTKAHGFILEPTTNTRTQGNSTNNGLMNIHQRVIMKTNQSEELQSEVKLDPNLRHHHSVTKTDKGKGKNIKKIPPFCRHSALHPEMNFLNLVVVEPRSHRAGNAPDSMKTLSVATYVR